MCKDDYDCYQRVYDLISVIASPTAKSPVIVHGYPCLAKSVDHLPEGARYGHAWLEFPDHGTCLDPHTRKLYKHEVYYGAGRIKEEDCKKYTFKEALEKILELKHWGPWDEIPEGVHFKGD